MNERLIRAAIALYPPEWRGRYGGELEQVTVDGLGPGRQERRRSQRAHRRS
jgi:hypothetical protein